ncbi:MAG TPA: nucleoside-diphosphate sugar epimerase/dehydratase [Nocardioidaceae bacterium]|nr:nucleoside-diphosphate sugar epimerase/dehydratase [Nocardioidaceae bacterium]
MAQLIPEQSRKTTRTGMRTLIVGAGTAGQALARDLDRVASFGLAPMGFLDDDPTTWRRRFRGHRVLGPLEQLGDVIESHAVEVVVLAIPTLDRAKLMALAAAAAGHGVSTWHLPSFLAGLQRQIAGTDMRALQVGSLIGRSEMHVVSKRAAASVTGKRVLVTGAGGSIGSELCRQLAAFSPETLVMLDHDETNLHGLQLDVWGEANLDATEVVVADIRDAERINQVFRDQRPDLVFHAAALKHLPALERHPCEGVKSNVKGTENLVEAAIRHGAERFVLISTDKAANPTSVLGATKRLAELVLDAHANRRTALCSVRFGNVLGSRGSLLHVLRDQLAKGKPVTITDPDATRFFMTIEEAVGLVLEAARMAEPGATYVLDMGEPVRILDLCKNFASMLNVHDFDFEFTGLRPGEKLEEELFGYGEERVGTDHPRIWKTGASEPVGGFDAGLHDLYDAAWHNRPGEVFECLERLVPEYTSADASTERAQGGGRLSGARERELVLAAPYPDDY